MELGFGGEVADFYHRYRPGYPAAAIDAVACTFALSPNDVVADLGCGTGQLTLPLADRTGAVLGIDPEPDMLARARRAAAERGTRNVSWVLGADTDLPAIGRALGKRRLAAVTVGQALHWMNRDELFHAVATLVRPGGGIAVLTNGLPMWLQDSAWSRALRSCMEDWLGKPVTRTWAADEQGQREYRAALQTAGFTVETTTFDRVSELNLDQVVGGVYSALPRDLLPVPSDRPAFAGWIRDAIGAHGPFAEHATLSVLTGRTATSSLCHHDDGDKSSRPT